MIILGGNQILENMAKNHYDIFKNRPTLKIKDWLIILKRAIQKK